MKFSIHQSAHRPRANGSRGRHAVQWLIRVSAALGITLFTVWGALALWFRMPSSIWMSLGIGVLGLAGACLIGQLLRRKSASWLWRSALAFAAITVVLLLWWQSIAPSHHRVWADDVEHLLESHVDGDVVTLRNVRNFEWRSETDYTPNWETRTYDLSRLKTADLVLSYWMGPHIAHSLVSFGFDDGQRLVFSLEIRKERDEAFSAVSGFFRQFEQVLIAADERDIIQTRSNARSEEVYLYSLNVPPEQLRAMFLGYLQEAQALLDAPKFYNTLTSNCTTIVFELAKHIAPALRPDYRLLLSGHLAEYAYDQGALVQGYAFPDLQKLGHINNRALNSAKHGEDFSHAIRQGIPQVWSHE